MYSVFIYKNPGSLLILVRQHMVPLCQGFQCSFSLAHLQEASCNLQYILYYLLVEDKLAVYRCVTEVNRNQKVSCWLRKPYTICLLILMFERIIQPDAMLVDYVSCTKSGLFSELFMNFKRSQKFLLKFLRIILKLSLNNSKKGCGVSQVQALGNYNQT